MPLEEISVLSRFNWRAGLPSHDKPSTILIFVLLGLEPVKAVTWDGSGIPNQGGDWSVGANWDSDTSPTVGASVILGDVSAGTRIINFDPAAEGAIGTLVFDQSSAGGTNELRILKDLTVTNGITLGALAGTERLTVGSSAGATFTLNPSGNISLNPGGELVLSATGNNGTGYNLGNLAGNNLTTHIAGGTLKIGQVTGTSSGTSAQNSITGNLSMSAGALVIENSQGTSERRLQVGGNVNITGGVISTTRAGTGGSLVLSGSANCLSPAFIDQDLKIQLDRISDQTLANNVALSSLTLRGSGVKTVTSSSKRGSVGSVIFIDGDNITHSSATVMKLGSDLNLISDSATALPNFSTSNQAPQSGRIDAGIDTNGFTFDLSAAGVGGWAGDTVEGWRPNEGPSSTTNAIWKVSGSGAVKATFFDFTSTDVTVNVASGTSLLAVGGNGALNDLGDAGGDPGLVDPASNFHYAGQAIPASPAVLTSNRPIGNLEISSGALRFQGVTEARGSTTIQNGELSLSYSPAVTSMLSDSAALRIGRGNLRLMGSAIEEVVGSTILESAASITRTSGSTVLNMGEITVNIGGSLDLSNAAIAKTTNSNDSFGMLGTWASINGTDWATSSAGTIVAFANYADVSRTDSGSRIIADDQTSNVRLVEGTGAAGNITLASTTTTVHTLNQSRSGGSSPAIIDMTDQVLAVDAILSGKSAGALTLGTVPNSGTLRSATPGGNLKIFNYGSSPLTVNSTIVNHATPTELAIGGTGTTTLAAVNDFTGKTFLNSGKLILADESSLGPAPASFTPDQLTINGGTLLCSSISGLSEANRGITLTESGGMFECDMTSSVEFTVANVISGPGRLTHAGLGTLSLIGNNTYNGDTILPNGGKIKLGHSNAIGSGKLILSESCQIDLTGGITVTNDVVLSPGVDSYSLETASFSNFSGSNVIDCNILAQIPFPTLRFTNNAEPGTSFTIGGTITGPTLYIVLRGSGGNSTPRYGFFNTPVAASFASLEIAGDTHWTIGSAGNDWAYTFLRSGTGNMILGIENALDTAARVKWGENATNCLDLNGYRQTVAGLDYTGVSTSGGVTNESRSDSTLRLEGLTTDHTFAGTIRDGATNRVHLVMSSQGRTQTLSGSLTYTGDTTIEAGTLALGATTAIADSSTVRINGATSILSLSNVVTDVVNALVIDGVMKAPGTWGTTASPATYKDDIHFSGTGMLQVVPYTTWANSFGLQEPWPGGDASLNGNRAADPDHDGLTNFEEFAFGLVPVSGTSPSPIVAPLDKATGVVRYTRRRPSLSGLQYHYFYSTSMVGEWPSFTPDFESIDLADPVETVSAAVPSSLLASPKLFIRVLAK